MNIVLLSQKSHHTGAIVYFLQKEQCQCKIAYDLCMLEKESRNNKLDVLFVEETFLHNKENTSVLSACLGALNKNIPIAFFNSTYFKPEFVQKDFNENINNHIINVITDVQKSIDNVNERFISQLRPAEKKLYELLKNKEDESISLEEMSVYLWGSTNKAHTSTLYSYIHRIKHILSECNSDEKWVIKEKKGHYKISFDALHIPNDIVDIIK